MLTGELRNQIDRIWDSFWSGGISNPLEVMGHATGPTAQAAAERAYVATLRALDQEVYKLYGLAPADIERIEQDLSG